MWKDLSSSKAKIVMALWLSLGFLPSMVQADDVGKFTELIGQVNLQKPGKPQAVEAKVNDGVETGDKVQTAVEARAQLKFLDNTVLNIAPNSQITIESYMFDAPKGTRRATFKTLQGLVHAVVEKAVNLQDSNFIMETKTASMGIRGTEWFVLNGPNFTDVFVKTGLISLKSLSSEKRSDLSRPIQSLFLILGGPSPALAAVGEILLGPMHASRAFLDQPPSPPERLTAATLPRLQNLMAKGLPTVMPKSSSPQNLIQKFNEMGYLKPEAKVQPKAKIDAAKKLCDKTAITAQVKAAISAGDTPSQAVTKVVASTIGSTCSVLGAEEAVKAVTAAAISAAIQVGLSPAEAINTVVAASTAAAIQAGLSPQQAISAVVSAAVTAATQSGLTPAQAVSMVTSAAITAATQVGISPPQAVSSVVNAAIAAALDAGLTPTQAISTVVSMAMTSAIQAGLTFQQAVNLVTQAAVASATQLGLTPAQVASAVNTVIAAVAPTLGVSGPPPPPASPTIGQGGVASSSS